MSIIWTDGKRAFPIDFRVYQKQNGISKNEHLRDMLRTAKERGFSPEFMMFDSWYSSNETLGLLQKWKWNYMVGIKSNRVFNGYMAGFQRVSIPLLKRAVEEHKMTFFSNLLRSYALVFLEIMLLCQRKPRPNELAS